MRSKRRYGPDKDGNWRMTVDPAILKMVKVGWKTWKPKQVFGSQKFILLPSSIQVD